MSLSASEDVRLERIRSWDVGRAFDAVKAMNAARSEGMSPKEDTQEEQEQVEESGIAQPAESEHSPPPAEQQHEPSADLSVNDGESECDSASSSSRCSQERSDFELMDTIPIDDKEDGELLPIVNVWPNVGAQFNEDGIPNPMEFAKQFRQIAT